MHPRVGYLELELQYISCCSCDAGELRVHFLLLSRAGHQTQGPADGPVAREGEALPSAQGTALVGHVIMHYG